MTNPSTSANSRITKSANASNLSLLKKFANSGYTLAALLAVAVIASVPSSANAQSADIASSVGMQYDMGALGSSIQQMTSTMSVYNQLSNNSSRSSMMPRSSTTSVTGINSMAPAMVQTGLLAPGSVSGANIPSGTWAFGFPTAGVTGTYHGAYAGQAMGGSLPQVSTTSTDINICDGVGYDGSANTGGAGGAGSTGAGGSAPVVPPYQIGPDWIAVQNSHNGQIMGWMAPGETYQQFFSGASGHLLPGADNAAEAQYILKNQLAGLGPAPDPIFGM